MMKKKKILSGVLALSLAASAFAGFTVAEAADAVSFEKEVVLYENGFEDSSDINRGYTYTNINGEADGTVGVETVGSDKMLVQRNTTTTSGKGNGKIVIDFDDQSSGILVVEIQREFASDIATDGRNARNADGVMGIYSSAGTKVADIRADGRGQNGANPWVKGAWYNTCGRLNNPNWMYGTVLKYELDLDNDKYKIFMGATQLSGATTGDNEFDLPSGTDVSKLEYIYSQNGEAIDDIKVYKKLSATQNFTDYTIVKGDTGMYDLGTMNPLTLSGATISDFNITKSEDAGNILQAMGTMFRVNAGKTGTAKFTAIHKEYQDIKFTFNIHVEEPATSIDITGDSYDMYIGQTKQLEYSLSPAGNAVQNIAWSSGNASVAAVDATGKITTGTATGTAVITVTAAIPGGNLTDTCTINVAVPQDALVITGDSEVMVKNTLQLSAASRLVDFEPGAIEWSLESAPSGTVIDSATGIVTAGTTAGAARAKASCLGGAVSATFDFNVIVPSNGLTIRDKQDVYELDIDTNNQIELDVIVLGGFKPDSIVWTKGSDPSNTITLTQNGDKALISANAVNTAGVTVEVSCYGGSVKDSCVIRVHRGVGNITVTGSNAVLNIGDRASLTGAIANSDTTINTADALSWRSSNHYVATVSGTGANAVVTAVGAGTAQIYYMGAGQQGSFTVTVNPKLDADGNIIEDIRTPNRVSFAEVKGSFSDIADMSWAQSAIQNVYSKGIMTPDSEYFFGAKRNIKRDEFVSVIIKTLGLEGEASEEVKKFDDVDESNPYYAEIMMAVELGIIKGINDTSFAPADDITRQDLSLVVFKALEAAKINTVEGRLDFADKADIAEYAQRAVRVLSKMNIMVGKDGGRFDPLANTTRAEAAVISEKIEAIR